ncbi:MAG: hypothetical protein KDD49_11050, partial [Bacteroidetes bacterium]|nr:hypothetical protein [Bacteroidota bacterium]
MEKGTSHNIGFAIWRGKFLVELVGFFVTLVKIENGELLWRHIAKPELVGQNSRSAPILTNAGRIASAVGLRR